MAFGHASSLYTREPWRGMRIAAAELRLFPLHGSLFFGESEKRTRGQGQALPPRVLMGTAYFWQVLKKR